MFAIKISIIYCFVGIATCQQVASDDERPFLRILAPKFICHDKGAKQMAQSNNLTIGLQTKEGQRLRYKISVDFEMLGGFKSQQHTLSIWKNIRMLQKKFANISDDISLKNQIEIAAQELTPQVIYTFIIVGFDEKNRSSETQNFTITFKGGELKAQNSNLGDGVSLLLFSSEFFYDDMELLAVAEVSFCDPNNEFSFQWKIDGLDDGEVETVKGNSLKLAKGTFKFGMSIVITVAVLNNQSETMASATLPVKILAKDFQVQVTPSECLFGTGREIPFQALISRQPSEEVNVIKWTCSQDDNDCSESLVNSSILTQLATFSNEGNYELKSEVTINDVTRSSSSKVGVQAKVIPHVQIKFFPSQPVNVMQPNTIVMTVLNLVPRCLAYWNIAAGDGFAEFKSKSEGNLTDMGLTFIKDFDEYFLQELVDYDNNTVSKDIEMLIPRDVMIPNEKYKFRLTITCPEPVKDSTTQAKPLNITSFYDIIVATNGPPETFAMTVQPLKGIAMKQKFKFSTGAAKDSSTNFPLKYAFGYIVNNIKVVIETFYENTVVHSQLPFADKVETFCEVCDNNGACGTIFGPTITVDLSHIYTTAEIDFKLAEFSATLQRAEYRKSMNVAVVLLLTQKKFTPVDSTLENKMLAMMKRELAMLTSVDASGFIYQQRIIEFVKMSKNVMSLMSVSDETFVDNLLSLTETINRSSKQMKRATFSRNLNSNVVNHDTDYIKNVLSLSEILLNSSNDTIVQLEKGKFLKKAHQFVASMCQDRTLNSQTIDSKFASIEVSKVFSPQLFVDAQKMRGDNESTILFTSNGNFNAKYVCVAKLSFTIDMFKQGSMDQSTPVYETIILDGEQGSYKAMSINEFAENVLVNIPVSSTDASLICYMWKDDDWTSDDCSKQKTNATNRIACKCKTNANLGVVIKAGKFSPKPTVSSEFTVYNQETSTEKIISTTPFTFLSTRTTIKLDAMSPQSTVSIQLKSSTPIESAYGSEPIKLSPSMDPPVTTSLTTSLMTSLMTSLKPAEVFTFKSVTSSSLALAKSSPKTGAVLPDPVVSTVNPSTPKYDLVKTTAMSTAESSSKGEAATTTAATMNTNSTSENITSVSEAATSWTLIIILVVFFLLILILFLIHRCRHYSSTHTNLPMRSPSDSIKYAKYHDEFTMRG